MEIKGHHRGYAGGFLRINLATRQVVLDMKYLRYEVLRKFVGGKGLGSYVLYNELKAGADPLGPDNKVVLLTGPLTGTGVMTASRITIVAKGPATGYWLDTGAGGFFGTELKKSGYDGIILEEVSEKPVYLYVSEEKVEILDASRIWGLTTYDAYKALREIHGEGVQIAAIGPAGERKSRISSIIVDGRAAARGGSARQWEARTLRRSFWPKGPARSRYSIRRPCRP